MRAVPPRQNVRSFSISQILVSFACFGVFFYVAYHLAHGDRGYFALQGLEKKLAVTEQKYAQKKQEREKLETRVKLLRPDSLDLDMLDERTRTVLGYVKAEERVVVTGGKP